MDLRASTPDASPSAGPHAASAQAAHPTPVGGVSLGGALRALADSQARYAALADAIGQMVWVADARGEMEDSPQWRAYTGQAPDEVRGTGWLAALHPDDRMTTMRAWDAALRGAAPYDVEYRIRRADGAYRWFRARAVPVRDGEGRVHEWVGCSVDVDAWKTALIERDRLVDALAVERGRLQAVLDHVPVGVALAEAPDGRIVLGNRQLEEVVRHPVLPSPNADAYGEWVAYHADGRRVAPHEFPLARAVREGVASQLEVHYQRGDGTRAWVRIVGAPIRDEAGRVTAGVVALVDVDEEHRGHEERERLIGALDAERQRLARLFEDAPAFIAVVRGRDHVFELANRPYYQLIGFRDVIGRRARDVLPELEGQDFFRLLDEALATGESFVGREVRITLRRTPGAPAEDRFVDFVYQPIVEADGSRSGVFVHGVDVTEQVRAREEVERARADAEQANRAKSDFLAAMSHELRTPLNAIAGYVELLELGIRGPLNGAQLADLERVRKSNQHLLALINDILNFAKLESGHVELSVAELSVAEALRDLEPLVLPQLTAKGLGFATACDPGAALRVQADAEKVRQILLNLLTNAVKFTDAGGRVSLSCDARDGVVRVHVHDTGRGIPPDKLERIFEPFVQIDRHLTPGSQQGVGLGLAISRDLARRMGGDLVAESVPGAGSTFTLELPRG